MSDQPLINRLASFEGIYCSGFLIPDQSFVTALSLIFEKVHFLNQLEYAIEFSKKYRFVLSKDIKLTNFKMTPTDPKSSVDPLANLTAEQKKTVQTYLFLSDQFFLRNASLFPHVFTCSLLPEGKVVSATLVKKGEGGAKNTYRVTKNKLVVRVEDFEELRRLISSGGIPVISNSGDFLSCTGSFRPNPKMIAANLAINALAISLPATKPARAHDILEAREKLRDHLPMFWASMLKLSAELERTLGDSPSPQELQREISDAVDRLVRPALIELVHKLEKERKDRFRNILTSTAGALKVLAGRPPTDLAGLVSGSLVAATDVALGFEHQLRKIEALKQGSGLTYLIEVGKALKAL